MFSVVQPDDAQDHDLVSQTLAGGHDAFAALVQRYQRPVLSIAYRLTRDGAAAQELAQEAFLRAYQSLSRFDQTRPFAPWLYRIVTNLGINWLKRKRLPVIPLDQAASDPDESVGFQAPDTSPGPEEQLLLAEQQARVWRAIAALSPKFRTVVELRHVRQLSYQEIADELDIPLSTVKVRLFRARKRLREHLESEDDV